MPLAFWIAPASALLGQMRLLPNVVVANGLHFVPVLVVAVLLAWPIRIKLQQRRAHRARDTRAVPATAARMTYHAAMAGRIAIGFALLLACSCASAQVLPPHPPLRVLIVSDEVNPHGLPPAQLTQPGEIGAALLATPALNLAADGEAVREVPTDGIEDATARLLVPRGAPGAYDVLVYFAHRIPVNAPDPAGRQAAFVAAVEVFLAAGGGVVSFHHGIYRTAGKEAMQALLHGEAIGDVPWNTIDGQNVVNVAPGHFVTTNGVVYGGSVAYADPAFGVPAGTYPFFNNTPDERYPTLNLLPSLGVVYPLFASDYVDNGATHILGYEQRRASWAGVVIAYQPGEYQPNALGPGNNNFQILLNAIVYAGTIAGVMFGDGFE